MLLNVAVQGSRFASRLVTVQKRQSLACSQNFAWTLRKRGEMCSNDRSLLFLQPPQQVSYEARPLRAFKSSVPPPRVLLQAQVGALQA